MKNRTPEQIATSERRKKRYAVNKLDPVYREKRCVYQTNYRKQRYVQEAMQRHRRSESFRLRNKNYQREYLKDEEHRMKHNQLLKDYHRRKHPLKE